ncbi:MAG: flagellar export chaperone FliS [Planctomycetes bacterium]|nr:flagellar export chaperone FliS [Planctomycetota bacterium]
MGTASNEYLRNAILTASPEQLLLMLYDGAIRFTRQGIQGIEGEDWEKAFTGFSRAQKVVLELLNSLNYDVDHALCTRMAGLYNYIYRHLVQACAERSASAAEEAFRFLEYQRETWVLLIDKLRQDRGGPSAPEPVPADVRTRGEGTYGALCLEG